jgi:hypothetical protein
LPSYSRAYQELDLLVVDLEHPAFDGDDGGRADLAIAQLYLATRQLVDRCRAESERMAGIAIDLPGSSG